MSDKKELRDQLQKGLRDLKDLGAEISGQMKKAGQQARERWKDDVEPKLSEMEGKLGEHTGKVEDAAGELFTEIGGALRKFADRLRSDSGVADAEIVDDSDSAADDPSTNLDP